MILHDPQYWTLSDVVALLTILTGLPYAVTRFVRWRKRRHRQKQLSKKFRTNSFYDNNEITDATQYYVRPDFSSVDPCQHDEIGAAIIARQSLYEAIDEFLHAKEAHKYLFLLGDSGMGKTAFVLSYYAANEDKPRLKRRKISVVPLGLGGADQFIASIEDKANTDLFLDGFDEDPKAKTNYGNRLLELMQLCREFHRVLITGRTQFFERDDDLPLQTGLRRVGARKLGEKGSYEFSRLYLAPLNPRQTREYMKKRYPLWSAGKRKRAVRLIEAIPRLSVRPMILAYIPDLLDTGAEIQYMYDLYRIMVEKWIQREADHVSPDSLEEFSERLAVDLYLKREQRGAERIPRDELEVLANTWNVNLDDWQMRSRSLLNRDAIGRYKFAHRSIMEYLFVKSFVLAGNDCSAIVLTDLMRLFVLEQIKARLCAQQPVNIDPRKVDISLEVTFVKREDRVRRRWLTRLIKDYGLYERNRNPGSSGLPELYEVLPTQYQLNFRKNGENSPLEPLTMHQNLVHKVRNSVEVPMNMVNDYATGLCWVVMNGGGVPFCDIDIQSIRDWANKQTLGGWADWRIPGVLEVLTLLRPLRGSASHINRLFISRDHSDSPCHHFEFGSCTISADKQGREFIWCVDASAGVCRERPYAETASRAAQSQYGHSLLVRRFIPIPSDGGIEFHHTDAKSGERDRMSASPGASVVDVEKPLDSQ